MICVETQPQTSRSERPRRRPATLARAVLMMFWVGVVATLAPSPSLAQPGGVLKEVGFDQNLDTQIPLTLTFRDDQGRNVRLADFFGQRPVILVMGYKNCPVLCSQVLAELTRSLRPLKESLGKEFDLINVSINPKETVAQADGQRRIYLKQYNQLIKRPGSESGWHSLVGDKASIDALAKSIGFRYKYSERTGVYAHAAGFVLLTPSGRISQYFYGIEYPAKQLTSAIATAAASKIASPIDKIVMYCYDYDPATGKYTFAIMRVIQVLGVATALALGIYMFAMVRRDRRMGRTAGTTFSELPSGPVTP